jgi:L-cysteine S-thiosulfotransferase
MFCSARPGVGAVRRTVIRVRDDAGGIVRPAWVIGLVAAFCASPAARASDPPTGRELAFAASKGNCLACHRIPSDPSAITMADIGPPLIGLRARYPERAKLAAQIRDATVANPETVMPPFGRNGVLTDAEIERIVDYLYER